MTKSGTRFLISGFWRKLKFLTQRRQFERDLDEEMRLHREMIGPDARRFGNATLLKEASREVWRTYTAAEVADRHS